MIPDIKPDLNKLIEAISTKSMYYGNKIPASVLALFKVEETENNAGILVPYWISVIQSGRGPRKNSKDHGLWKTIYKWMEKHNRFTKSTQQGKINEAKSVTWYINKYGNKHFRSKVFIDIYETETKKTIAEIDRKFSLMIGKITSDVI